MEPDNLKTAICDALAAFIRSRPGFDYANYGDASSYNADVRRAARQKRDAETMLAAVRWRDSITGADLIEAARGGRLTIIPPGMPHYGMESNVVRISYCVGQYRPTEYRAGVCRVLASALWNYARDNMPAPSGYVVTDWGYPADAFGKFATRDAAEACLANAGGREAGHVAELYDGRTAGDYLRRKFRAEFGSAMQRRWFD